MPRRIKLKLAKNQYHYSSFKNGDILNCELCNSELNMVKYQISEDDIWFFIIGENCELFDENHQGMFAKLKQKSNNTINKLIALFV